MKEPVRKTKHPWLVGACVAVLAGLYVVLLAVKPTSDHKLDALYATEINPQDDSIEVRYEETGRIEPNIEDPRALATDSEGKIYVAGKGAVAVFGADGVELDRFEVNGTPTAMALRGDGALLLGMKDHVEVVDNKGVTLATWDSLGERGYITSVVASDEEVFVADAGNRVVIRYSHEGALLGRIGEADPERDVPGLLVPSPYLDVALDHNGALWVVNPGRLGLESYRSDGGLITSWYRPSLALDGFSGCCNPSHIAFRGDGKLVTAEKGLVRIKVYDSTLGELQETVSSTDMFLVEQSIRDIAIDSKDRILVLDPRQNAIRIFEAKDVENHG